MRPAKPSSTIVIGIEQAEQSARIARREADHACPVTALVTNPVPVSEPATPFPAPVVADAPIERPQIAAPAKVLGKVSGVLLHYPKATIKLEGHSDQRGDATCNTMLSDRRTQAVKDYLVKAEVPGDHIATASFGHSLPLTKTGQNRDLAWNCRVVIAVTNDEEKGQRGAGR